MHKNFLDKLVEHGNGQLVEVLILTNQSDKTVSVLFVLLIALDSLFQNYLKRKASGAQKRYEDKIKERKKAEIEAKKAAIRAEDIAKGVFVPVSSLPQREPMKGVQSA